MKNDLIYPVEVRANPTANGGWEWMLLVGRTPVRNLGLFTDEWVDPAKMLPKLLLAATRAA